MSTQYVSGDPSASRPERQCHVCDQPSEAHPKDMERRVCCDLCRHVWHFFLCGNCVDASTDPDGTRVNIDLRLPWWECGCSASSTP